MEASKVRTIEKEEDDMHLPMRIILEYFLVEKLSAAYYRVIGGRWREDMTL